jgi:hypothetical protein
LFSRQLCWISLSYSIWDELKIAPTISLAFLTFSFVMRGFIKQFSRWSESFLCLHLFLKIAPINLERYHTTNLTNRIDRLTESRTTLLCCVFSTFSRQLFVTRDGREWRLADASNQWEVREMKNRGTFEFDFVFCF